MNRTAFTHNWGVVLLGLLVISLPSSVLAADEDQLGLSEDDFLAELPVVLSATRLSQPLTDAPVAMTVIDRETILASGATTIPDVLRLVPGFQVGYVTGSKITATYHGMSDRYARNMQVLVDGRSVYDAGFGGVVWSDLPVQLEDVRRIEVVRGPSSSVYGANAFSATINIMTYHPAEQPGNLVKVLTGSRSTIRTLARHADSVGNFDYRFTLMADENEGLESRYDDAKTGLIGFRGDYQVDSQRSLMIKAGYSDGTRDDGFGSFFDDEYFDIYQPEREVEHHYAFEQLRWSQTLSSDDELIIQLYHNYQRIKDNFETVLFSEYLTDEEVLGPGVPVTPDLVSAILGWEDQRLKLGYGLSSERYDLELQHIFRLSPAMRIVWGLGARQDSSWGLATFGDDDRVERSQIRAFINDEWKINPQLVVNGGVMAESYDGFKPYYSPRAALNFHPDRLQTLRASYSQAVRMPTLLESNAYTVARFQDESPFDVVYIGSDDLKPEEIESFELGYVGQFPQAGLTIDFKLYEDNVKNFIGIPIDRNCKEPPAYCAMFGPDDLQGAHVYMNAGNATITGHELGLTFKPTPQTLIRAAYAFARVEGRFIRRINHASYVYTYDDFASLTPRHTYSVLLARRLPDNIDVSLAYYRQDGFDWFGEGNEPPGYDRVDVKFSHSARLNGADGKLSLILRNIGNHYTDFQDENKIGPESYISYELSFY